MLKVVRAAPAKVNLWLQVTGRRADGYHLLDSLVAFAGLADRVEICPADRDQLAVDGPLATALEAEADNIVRKAARALAAHAGNDAATAIRLTKNIPVAAGLGGGSSDAAALLLALQDLWKLPVGDGDLQRIAARLGADVPMCLAARAAQVGGVGEELRQLVRLPPCAMVLVNPRIALPTPDVFHAYARTAPRMSPAEVAPASFTDLELLASAIAARDNDLTRPACELVPAIETILAALRGHPAVRAAAMSGSGATCYGLVDDIGAAADVAGVIRARHPDWWIWAGPMHDPAGATALP